MGNKSAGILAYRKKGKDYEVFLVHPGGPYWENKEINAWSIPKGEFDEDEDPFFAAKREFKEETSFDISGKFTELKPVKQPGRKVVYTWAIEAELNASKIKSNTFELEWPPKSGKMKEFPEVDKAAWYPFKLAKEKILKGQIPILEQLERKLGI